MAVPVVYIIYSEKLDKYYIGKGENFAKRLEIHNSDENEKWSSIGRPWVEFLVIKCASFILDAVESQSNYTRIITEKSREIISRKTLKEFEAQLCISDLEFMRMHNSFIINLNKIRNLNPWNKKSSK